ncbi:MAG TPA: SMI1/KNR4 family protein [Tepidisphaeraceae bacterium]|jgi:hypothetical protein|nr:SMI1/KNR4 family protein [Tepidisphaeraceae bacterium]
MNARLLNMIGSDEENTYKGGASDRQIALAEKRLAVSFPESYRDFLRCFNGGEFTFGRMYRISKGGAGFFDLVDEMNRASEHLAPFRERSLLLFGDDYSGSYYCLDLSNTRKRTPVVFWDRGHGEKQLPQVVALTLQDFIIEGLRRNR